MYILSLFEDVQVGAELSTLATTLQKWIKYLTQIGMPIAAGILVASVVFFCNNVSNFTWCWKTR